LIITYGEKVGNLSLYGLNNMNGALRLCSDLRESEMMNLTGLEEMCVFFLRNLRVKLSIFRSKICEIL